MARLLGAHSINIDVREHNKGGYFRFFDDANQVVAGGVIMPFEPDPKLNTHAFTPTRSIPGFDEPVISLDLGREYMQQLIAQREAAQHEHDAKKVWRCSVMKIGYVIVEASSAEEAQKLVEDNYINDRVFDESDVLQGPYVGEELSEEELETVGDEEPYKPFGILTEKGWQKWDDWYDANGFETVVDDND